MDAMIEKLVRLYLLGLMTRDELATLIANEYLQGRYGQDVKFRIATK